MFRNFPEALVGQLAILGMAATVSCFSYGGDAPFLLSKDHDTVFREEAFTATDYFHFGKDGKYRQINREHMFTAEMDRGTWKQDANGQIELRSSIRVKTELRTGPLCISVHDLEQLDALRPLEKDISTFLAADERDIYPKDEIEHAWMYTYTWSLFESKETFNAVEIEDGVEKVTRKQLAELLIAWRAYLKDDTKNRFHFVPVRYHKFVLLSSSDYPLLANAETPEKVKQVADTFGGAAASDTPPPLVYVLVDSGPALKEMKTNQPFIFYPEMNGVGGEKLLKYKESQQANRQDGPAAKQTLDQSRRSGLDKCWGLDQRGRTARRAWAVACPGRK